MKRLTKPLLPVSIAGAARRACARRAPAFGVSFSTAVDTSTTILGGTGTFTDFPTAPAISYGTSLSWGWARADK